VNHEKHETHEKILFKEESFSGFLEGVYQECLAIEFRRRNIPFEAQKNLSLAYRGEPLKQVYRADSSVLTPSWWELKGGQRSRA
jgi:GxxExxY protein